VGLRVPHELPAGAAGLRDYAARAAAAGIDRLFTGDHVAFQGGHGFDWLVTATALAVAAPRLTVQTAVYLLPLRHPVPVARQVVGFYQVPFGKFEKYSPCGTAGQIAESLRPYVEAGCRSFNLIPVADSQQAAIDGAAEIRALLRSEPR
jgi:hypothetical protein